LLNTYFIEMLGSTVLSRRDFALGLVAFSLGKAVGLSEDGTRQWVQEILSLWQWTCREKLNIAPEPLAWLIIYDETRAWHINPEVRLLPPRHKALGKLRFAGKPYDTYQLINHGKLWVPSGTPLDLKAQAATMVYDHDTKPFFISASVAYQQRAEKQSGNSDFRNFFTSLTLHELTHTRQLPQTMRQIGTLKAKYKFPSSLNDNLIEATFGSNPEFRKIVDEEKKHLVEAVMANSAAATAAEAAEALRKMRNRRKRFFVGEFEGWSEMEDVFLGLEGLAMWVQFQSSLKLAPAGTPWLNTLGLLSERTDAWSQSEGLGIFLAIDRLQKDWQPKFFGAEIPSPTSFLQTSIADRSST
jgi:hypothetical protein